MPHLGVYEKDGTPFRRLAARKIRRPKDRVALIRKMLSEAKVRLAKYRSVIVLGDGKHYEGPALKSVKKVDAKRIDFAFEPVALNGPIKIPAFLLLTPEREFVGGIKMQFWVDQGEQKTVVLAGGFGLR